MHITKVDWEKEMTQHDFLEGLHQVLQIDSSRRQLTELRSKGWLPELHRRSCPGSKKPVYVWNEAEVEQALFLFDLLQVSHADHWIRLALWLRGYTVDFAPVRQRWLDSIDAYLQAFTQGEADDPLDNITDVVSRLESKWEHTPTRHRPHPLQQVGLGGYAQWTELFLDMFLVPGLDIAIFAELLDLMQTMNGVGGNTQWEEEFVEDAFPWVQLFQEMLAMPRLREVIEQATAEEWEQARVDYATLCQFARTVFAPVTQAQPNWIQLLFFVPSGFYLVPVALAIRSRGYGEWIDRAFAWMSEQLTNPAMQNWLADQFSKYRTGSSNQDKRDPEAWLGSA